MKKGHVPVRTCIGCRQRRPQSELIRITAPDGSSAVADPKQNLGGRGCYVCPERPCLQKALNSARLARALRTRVTSVPAIEDILRRLEKEG